MSSIRFGITRPIALLSLVIVLAGCDSFTAIRSIELSTTRGAYEAGDPVQIRLVNGSRHRVGYNICFAFVDLQSKTNGEWEDLTVELGPDDQTACTAELRGLHPGGTADGTIHLPRDLPAGTYRLTHYVEVNDTRHLVTTGSFKISDG